MNQGYKESVTLKIKVALDAASQPQISTCDDIVKFGHDLVITGTNFSKNQEFLKSIPVLLANGKQNLKANQLPCLAAEPRKAN